jgi:hypothetical protein
VIRVAENIDHNVQYVNRHYLLKNTFLWIKTFHRSRSASEGAEKEERPQLTVLSLARSRRSVSPVRLVHDLLDLLPSTIIGRFL